MFWKYSQSKTDETYLVVKIVFPDSSLRFYDGNSYHRVSAVVVVDVLIKSKSDAHHGIEI